MSDVPVTRHFSLISETIDTNHRLISSPDSDLTDQVFPREARFHQTQTFCDWVSIYQSHSGIELPKISDGAFVRYDSHGAHESTTLKKCKVEGSHETGVFIRCDGSTVWFEGNVSRFGRADNVFGFTFDQCLTRINTLVKSLGLPPFTSGKGFSVRCGDADRKAYTGARITRLDVTQNFFAGSAENASFFMHHMQTQQASRLKTGTFGDGETVDFGRGSRRIYSKLYLKGPELRRHMKKQRKGESCAASRPFDPYINDLAAWCDEVGLVRFETTYKSTFLIDNQHNYLGGLDMRCLETDFLNRQDVFTRATCELDEISSLEKSTLAVYRMWQAGDAITEKFSRAQFYKHRAKLLPFGVDIAIKSNVINFVPRVRVIKLAPAVQPSFYQLPQPSFIRLAA